MADRSRPYNILDVETLVTQPTIFTTITKIYDLYPSTPTYIIVDKVALF